MKKILNESKAGKSAQNFLNNPIIYLTLKSSKKKQKKDKYL